VMDYTDGNQSLASEILGISRATLRKKLKQYRLHS
jgi:DNA-binding protein Fis